jgi:PBP1b-binding outer membrane lipoprotein LpoB
MKKVILVLSSALFLLGCAADDSKNKEVEQTPRFGKPESAIPWNQPTDWEKSGQLGSMPGFEQQH